MDTLLSTDRCDRCGSQAYTRFVKDGKDLDFCRHHGNALFDALNKAGWEIAIDTRKLLERPVGAGV